MKFQNIFWQIYILAVIWWGKKKFLAHYGDLWLQCGLQVFNRTPRMLNVNLLHPTSPSPKNRSLPVHTYSKTLNFKHRSARALYNLAASYLLRIQILILLLLVQRVAAFSFLAAMTFLGRGTCKIFLCTKNAILAGRLEIIMCRSQIL